ncbi:MAG: hypothetical protein JSR82_21375 [Verrucomicrobia bacterium]|nr:hypothetical protein [Verrucomicrobiota bacterium]
MHATGLRRQSKAQSQQRWLQKPENTGYFRGPEASERVRRWRKNHPGYWRKKAGPAAPSEPAAELPLALQDLGLQPSTVLVGLLATLSGRGRDAGFPAPPAQIPAGGITAPGSYLEFWRQIARLAKGG